MRGSARLELDVREQTARGAEYVARPGDREGLRHTRWIEPVLPIPRRRYFSHEEDGIHECREVRAPRFRAVEADAKILVEEVSPLPVDR